MSVLGWILLGLMGLALVVVWSIAYQLVRQQGRTLIRLDQLEELVAGAQQRPSSARASGLAIGTLVPPFRLPDLSGSEWGLEDFRGKHVLLVHWDPGCGFCRQIGPELAALQGGLRKRKTELILVSHRDADSNRALAEECGLDCPIVLQPEREVVAAFSGLGTPAAYLLDEEGRVARPLAVGADRVPVLASEAARGKEALASERALAESRIERSGIPAGSRAPSFRLPDLQGREISLDDYSGRRVLIVFSDPTCGPCDAVSCDLARFEREHRANGLDVLMVSRGPVDENRRKACEQGIEFPVVVQPGWNVSKQYGIFATPVAFLVDERGVIARDVARGGPEIMQLALQALPAGDRTAPKAR
jgi:peroxiredoxin